MPFVASVTWLTCKSCEKRCGGFNGWNKIHFLVPCAFLTALSIVLTCCQGNEFPGCPKVFCAVDRTAARCHYSCTWLYDLFHHPDWLLCTMWLHVTYRALWTVRGPRPVMEEAGRKPPTYTAVCGAHACMLSGAFFSLSFMILRDSPFYRFGNWGFRDSLKNVECGIKIRMK